MVQERHLFLAGTLGFCDGVRRALAVVEQELAAGHVPLYVLHEIVHNNSVTDRLRKQGVFFVNDPADVPDGAYLVLGAHGTAPAVRQSAAARLQVVDATCPQVSKVQNAAVAAEKAGERIILLGYPDHQEAAGIVGHCRPGTVEIVSPGGDWSALAPDDSRTVCLLSQTTMNTEDVAAAGQKAEMLFAHVRNGAEVCHVSRARQAAVRSLAKEVEYMLVLGSLSSSNARRLLEIALRENVAARLVDSPEEISPEELAGISRLGLCAGASVPDELVALTVVFLQQAGFTVNSPA